MVVTHAGLRQADRMGLSTSRGPSALHDPLRCGRTATRKSPIGTLIVALALPLAATAEEKQDEQAAAPAPTPAK